jgi:hypothetical protein
MKAKKAVLDILKTCKAVEERRLNPFLIDFQSSIKILREYLASCKTLNDYCLDAKALNALSKVVEFQNAQLIFQSSKLYVNPEALKKKVYSSSLEVLAKAFLENWHPIVELEQLTIQSIINGLIYWRKISFYQKHKAVKSNFEYPTIIEEKQALKESEKLSSLMVKLWREMIELTSKDEKIDYWVFISKNDFSTTVKRAYITSFLITYGYASLITCENKLYLIPNRNIEKINYEDSTVSFPISIKKGKL